MSVTAEDLAPSRPGGLTWLWKRQLEAYPDTGPRTFYLAITVLATVTLYYELYVGASVSTLLLVDLHMSFTFFVLTLAFGNLIGAFGSLFAGIPTGWAVPIWWSPACSSSESLWPSCSRRDEQMVIHLR